MTGARFKPYLAYKASGIEWLGEIPVHWEIFRLHYLADVVDPQPDHRAPAIREVGGFPYVGIRDLRSDGTVNTGTARQVSEEAVVKQEASFSINEGDIVFCKVGTLGLPRLIKLHCRLALSATLVLVKPHLHRLSRFLRYALDAPGTYTQISLASTGSTRSALGIEQIRRFSIPFTSDLEEASYIADFLDRETAKIDALVEKKERLIELLQEKRTALITQAVTKGLDSNIPMKDSGIEWLGQIPAHWEVKKVTRLFTIGSGTTPNSEDSDYYGDSTPWVTTSELRETIVNETQKHVTRKALDDYPSLKVHKAGSVVVAMYGATIGRVGVLGVAATVNQACCVFSPLSQIASTFAFYWFQMARLHLVSLGTGGGQPNLSQELLRSIRIPIPTLDEQREITDFLGRETAKIDALITKVGEAIERLKEYRTALISAAVTGKIDVRGEAISVAVQDA